MNWGTTNIGRRLSAVEQMPTSRAFDSTEPRDPKTMTSWDIFARLEELRAKARRITAERIASGAPGPLPSAETIRTAARIAELRVRAAELSGTRPPRRALTVPNELEADDA